MSVADVPSTAESASLKDGRVLPPATLPLLGAGLSMLVCYGKTLMLAVLAFFMQSEPHFNPHLQAILMWALGAVAVYGLMQDRRIHGKLAPFVLGIAGVVTIIVTLYGIYNPAIELSGYVLLLTAAFLNQVIILRYLNRQVESKAQEVERLNAGLETRVQEQIGEIERLAQLRRFLSPEVADLVTRQQENPCCKATARSSPPCTAICAASPSFHRRRNPKKSSTCCRRTTNDWAG